MWSRRCHFYLCAFIIKELQCIIFTSEQFYVKSSCRQNNFLFAKFLPITWASNWLKTDSFSTFTAEHYSWLEFHNRITRASQWTTINYNWTNWQKVKPRNNVAETRLLELWWKILKSRLEWEKEETRLETENLALRRWAVSTRARLPLPLSAL